MKGIQAYKRQAVTLSTNEFLILRLFEQAIFKMWEGHGLLTEKNKIDAIAPLQHTRQIICELMTSLDHEEGGEIAANLHQLYLWLLKEISRAGFEGDPVMLEGAIQVMENIYSGFKEAFSPDEG